MHTEKGCIMSHDETHLSLTDVAAFLADDLVDECAVVEAVDEVAAWRSHQRTFQSTEEDAVQLLNIMLARLLPTETQLDKLPLFQTDPHISAWW